MAFSKHSDVIKENFGIPGREDLTELLKNWL